jgi:hypothetical protein
MSFPSHAKIKNDRAQLLIDVSCCAQGKVGGKKIYILILEVPPQIKLIVLDSKQGTLQIAQDSILVIN